MKGYIIDAKCTCGDADCGQPEASPSLLLIAINMKNPLDVELLQEVEKVLLKTEKGDIDRRCLTLADLFITVDTFEMMLGTREKIKKEEDFPSHIDVKDGVH